jgi:O-antigen/teichoic acid export membrane protein
LSTGFQWLLARTLGPAAVGIIGLALSVTGLASLLSLFGLPNAVMRFTALHIGQKDRARAAGVIVTGVRIVGITSITLAVVLFAASDLLAQRVFDKPAVAGVLRVFTISLPFSAFMSFFLAVTQGLKRMGYRVAIEKMIVPILKIGGLIVTVYVLGYHTIGVAYALLGVSVLGAVLAAMSVWRLYPLRGRDERPIPIVRDLLAFSWPLLLTGIVNRALQELETLVLGALVSSEQVGIYYLSLRITVLITLFLTSFSTIFAPVIAELHGKKEKALMESMLKTVTKWGFSLSLPAFLVLFTFSDKILLAFGPGFTEGATALRILALSQLFNVATGPVGWMLTMTGHPRLNLFNAVLLLVANIVLAIILVPQYGIVGAAFSEALVIFFINLLRLVEVYVILRTHPYRLSYLKPLTAGLLAAATLLGIQQLLPGLPLTASLVLSTLAALLVYAAVLLVLRLDDDDRMILNAYRRRLARSALRGNDGE